MASRFDRFENSICQNISKQTDQMPKQVESTSRQNKTIVQSIKDVTTAIVERIGSAQQSVDGQSQNVNPPRSQALPEDMECYRCGWKGHHAKNCPNKRSHNP